MGASYGRPYTVHRGLRDGILRYIEQDGPVTVKEVSKRFKIGRERTGRLLKLMLGKRPFDAKLVEEVKGVGRTILYKSPNMAVGNTFKKRVLGHKPKAVQEVYRLVEAEPGLTGPQIEQLFAPINKRTTRSRLKVLRDLGAIRHDQNSGYVSVIGATDWSPPDTTFLTFSEWSYQLVRRLEFRYNIPDVVEAATMVVQTGLPAYHSRLLETREKLGTYDAARAAFAQVPEDQRWPPRVPPAASLLVALGELLGTSGAAIEEAIRLRPLAHAAKE